MDKNIPVSSMLKTFLESVEEERLGTSSTGSEVKALEKALDQKSQDWINDFTSMEEDNLQESLFDTINQGLMLLTNMGGAAAGILLMGIVGYYGGKIGLNFLGGILSSLEDIKASKIKSGLVNEFKADLMEAILKIKNDAKLKEMISKMPKKKRFDRLTGEAGKLDRGINEYIKDLVGPEKLKKLIDTADKLGKGKGFVTSQLRQGYERVPDSTKSVVSKEPESLDEPESELGSMGSRQKQMGPA